MGDQAGAAAETASSNGTAGGGETSKPMTAADIEAIVDKALKGYTSKINGELAGVRKRLDGGGTNGTSTGETPVAKPAESKPANGEPPITRAELDAHREIGRLEAGLPEDLQAELAEETKGLSYSDAARLYRTAKRVHDKASAQKVKEAGGETPAKTGGETPKTSRAAVPATRETAPRPRTMKEYVELGKTDPKRKAALDADDSFDPNELSRN